MKFNHKGKNNYNYKQCHSKTDSYLKNLSQLNKYNNDKAKKLQTFF